MTYRLLYFASLRDSAGVDSEQVESAATDARTLYRERRAHYAFAWDEVHLRVAINGQFASWEQRLSDGDEVVFIAPVSGG